MAQERLDLKRFDKIKWVCICKNWQSFTYGKIYEGELDRSGTLLNIPNDSGKYNKPCLFGTKSNGVRIFYFMKLEEWRNRQIDQIL